MKKFTVLAATYTSKGLGEIDVKTMSTKNSYRYRHDIFPDPAEFGIRIMSVVPELVSTGDAVYPYRMKLTVVVPEAIDDAVIAKYKAAIDNKTRRFEIVHSPTAKKPEEEKPAEQGKPAKKPAEKPIEKEKTVEAKSKKKKKTDK